VKQFIAIFIFLILLSVPYGIKKYDEVVNAVFQGEMSEVIERYGFYLEDVTEQIGVNFIHQRVTIDEKLHHILPQISAMGASVSVVDFNNDGLQDFYLTNSEFGTSNALYKNLGEGSFIDVAAELGIANLNLPDLGASMGTVWGDYNNDGYEDLFLYRWGRPELFRNDGGNGFTRVTESAGFISHINSNTAIWFDYNNNGYLDLFIGGYYHEDVNLFNLEDTRMMPDSYEYATNGGLNYLYENQGDGTFRDVSEAMGLQDTRKWTLAALAADINDSGFPDLILANDYGVDEIFINEGGEGFLSVGEQAGIGFVPKSGMSVGIGDILNQGRYSIYITNISEAGVLMQGNNLWVPGREPNSTVPRYRNLAGNMGVEIGDWAYGGLFVDLDNSGYIDLYVANGYVSDEPDTDYWYDYSRVVGGNRNVIIDAVNWPAMDGRTFSGYQTNKIWLNDGAGRFRDVSGSVVENIAMDSRSVASADLFGDGSLDLIVANQNQTVTVYKNYGSSDNNWIGFHLIGNKSNKSAIGATLLLHWDDKLSKKDVSGGGSFSSQNQRTVHFGLGDVERVEKLEIRWPSGIVQEINSPDLNMNHTIEEPSDVTTLNRERE